MRRKSRSCGVSEFWRLRLASASPWARVTIDLASPSASAIFFAASACAVANSLRALGLLDGLRFRGDGRSNDLRHTRSADETKLLHGHAYRDTFV